MSRYIMKFHHYTFEHDSAALHFNENSERQQSTTRQGKKQCGVSYPKGRGGEGVAKEVKVDQTFCEYIYYNSK